MGTARKPTSCTIAFVAIASALALAACGSSGHAPMTGGSNGYTSFLNFSKCMRAHRVTNFPDPPPGGGIQIGPSSGINPQAPAFQSAQASCKHLLPGGGPPAIVSESTKLALLKQAECMRAHGVRNYPDPMFPKGGGVESVVPQSLDPTSPAFQSALKACGGGANVPVSG